MPVPDVSERSIAELISLKGKNAVVTGGARGIGFAISKRFAEAGATILIGDLNPIAAKASTEYINKLGGRAISSELDVKDGNSVRELANLAVHELGNIDIWVNNVGIYPTAPVLEISDADWDYVLDTNMRSAFIGAREAGQRMVKSGKGGVIINFASVAAYKVGGDGLAHYVASKHGVCGLTKGLAVELGPYGIRVLALAPTLTETPGVQEARSAPGSSTRNEFGDQFTAHLPLRRTAVPDDVARVALFCASDLAILMTGSTLLVDAGDAAL